MLRIDHSRCVRAPIAADIPLWIAVEKVHEAKSISVKKPNLYRHMRGCDPWGNPWGNRHDIRCRAEDRRAARGDEHAPGRLQ
jgi:hypothetical protein